MPYQFMTYEFLVYIFEQSYPKDIIDYESLQKFVDDYNAYGNELVEFCPTPTTQTKTC